MDGIQPFPTTEPAAAVLGVAPGTPRIWRANHPGHDQPSVVKGGRAVRDSPAERMAAGHTAQAAAETHRVEWLDRERAAVLTEIDVHRTKGLMGFR